MGVCTQVGAFHDDGCGSHVNNGKREFFWSFI